RAPPGPRPHIRPPGGRSACARPAPRPGSAQQATFAAPATPSHPAEYAPVRPREPARNGRVTPPWQADDLPSEPPTLRLVEPSPAPPPTDYGRDPLGGTPSLRLVGSDNGSTALDRPMSAPSEDGDGDPLIFAQAPAWLT